MMMKILKTKKTTVAINDNHNDLDAFRSRQTDAWAKTLAHQIERNRFLNAWGQIGQQTPILKGV